MINCKQCKKCDTFHFNSYFITPKSEVKEFYTEAHTQAYFHVTQEIIFEKKLLEQFMADIMFKQCSFRAFAEAYNYLYGNFDNHKPNQQLNRQRLTEVFYIFNIIQFNLQHKIEKKLKCKISFFKIKTTLNNSNFI